MTVPEAKGGSVITAALRRVEFVFVTRHRADDPEAEPAAGGSNNLSPGDPRK